MVRCGFTSAGTQRWKCSRCKKVRCRRRADNASRNVARLRTRWLSGVSSLSSIAREKNVHRTTLSRRFAHLPHQVKHVPLRRLPNHLTLILDGTKIAVDLVVLIAYEYVSRQPLAWAFVERETYATWHSFLIVISEKHAIGALVSDGQKGLKKAINQLFPTARHQRCMAHVVRLSLAWLTKQPQSEAGRELRSLVGTLRMVRTKKDALRWERALNQWDARHAAFLSEKSINPATGRKWYTHRKLRAVRSLVVNALPGLFYYTRSVHIPNTTNHVEGGINAPLKELLGRHRGITYAQKELLVSQFLYDRRKGKSSTRNAT